MACTEGRDIATRIVFLDHIRVRYTPKYDPYKDYPLSHYFMATFQMRGPRDLNYRRVILHFYTHLHESESRKCMVAESRKCLVPGDAYFLDIIQMHSPKEIQDLSVVSIFYRKWAHDFPYLMQLPTNATPRTIIDIFGLSDMIFRI